MKCIVFCPIGMEDILKKDIKELLGKDCIQNKGCCIFDGNEKEISKFCYKCQSIESAGLLLDEGEMKDDFSVINIDEIKEDMINNVFSLDSSIIGDKPFKSNDIVSDVSQKIMQKTKKKATYKSADIGFFVQIIDDKYYLYINLASKELGKRDHKVFVNKTSLRGPIAYGVFRISEAGYDDEILDCFCRSGEIGIEAVHYFSGKSLNFYAKDKFVFDKLGWKVKLDEFDTAIDKEFNVNCIDSAAPNVKAAEKNAKIAGVNKIIKFSRIVIEDLDLKFRNEIDKIVTQLPAIGKESENRVMKTYRDFFEICEKVMKKEGTITCIGLNIDPAVEIAKQNGYVLKHERIIMQGKEELKLFIFAKK